MLEFILSVILFIILITFLFTKINFFKTPKQTIIWFKIIPLVFLITMMFTLLLIQNIQMK